MKDSEKEKFVFQAEDFSPAAIAESGQCFRMKELTSESWSLVAHGRELVIEKTGDNTYSFGCSGAEFENIWKNYFDLENDYSGYRKICLPDDEYLREAMDFGSGIRILNQEPFEMLISFIISQRKSVPAIRTSIERLAEGLGERISDGAFAFPTPERIASAGTEFLSSCGLGYRVEYVRSASEAVLSGEIDLEEISHLPTTELIEKLMGLKGVGIKVASCVALFAYHRLDTVPVDVWMKRVIDIKYGGKLPEEYERYAGVLQQYMFNYARLKGVM